MTESGIPCRCGRWHHRAPRGFLPVGVVPAIPGGYVYSTEGSICPKCRNAAGRRFNGGTYLILFRVEFVPFRRVPVGLAPILGTGRDAMRAALEDIRFHHPDERGLTDDAIEGIIASAEASAAPGEAA